MAGRPHARNGAAFMSVDHDRVKEILFEAVSMPPEARRGYLDGACGADAPLRRRVESLLRAHDDAGRLMASPSRAGAPAAAALAAAAADLAPGRRIGAFRLLRAIGEGGFGTVFLAEQEHPVRRLAAVKLLKPGMDSRQIVARFEAERQAMAMMDHPGIAKVLEAGATDTGRPYFVMEYVDGRPVTEYCDLRRLGIPERLELFRKICLAVQHAHQKGVVHRDLKPTNVLVAEIDGQPAPKVIDFGIAKALGGPLGERLSASGGTTQAMQFVGTPEYMAPEQATLGGIDVDTRADVYALGVLLYELLAGTAPFERTRLRAASAGEIERIIREETPPRPSTRIAGMGAAADAIAAVRRLDGRRLRSALRGDLDWIVMRAMEKDRTRRYPAVDALAADVRRYLANEPVEAGPPSALYRLGKFWRRHRVAASAAALVALILVASATVSAVAASAARTARNEAVDAEHAAASHAYAANMLAASSALHLNDPAGARWHLDTAPAALHGWEWHHLRSCVDRSLWVAGPFSEQILNIALSPDTRLLAAAGATGLVHLFDARDGGLRHVLRGLRGMAIPLAFTLDGGRLFAGDTNGGVAAWDLATGRLTARLERHGGRVDGLALVQEGRVLLSAGWDGSIRRTDAATLADLGEVGSAGAPISLLAATPDGRRVASASWDQRMRLWDGRSGQLIVETPCAHAHTPLTPSQRFAPARITALKFSPDGEEMVVATADGRLTWWRAEDGELLQSADIGRFVRELAFTDDGSLLAAACIDAVAAWDTKRRTSVFAMLGHDDDVRSVAFVPGTDLLASASFDQSVRLWSAWRGRELSVLTGHDGGVYQVVVSPDGARAFTRAGDNTVRAWPLEVSARQALGPLSDNVIAVAAAETRGGLRVVAAPRTGPAVVLAMDSSEPLARLGRAEAEKLDLAVSPDGEIVAVAGADGIVELCDLASGASAGTLKAGAARVNAVAFSTDGGVLATGDDEGAVRLWSMHDRSELLACTAGSPVHALAFVDDGGGILAACGDGALRRWNASTGRLEQEIVAPTGLAVRCLAVSPDGATVAFGGDDRVVRLAELATGRLVRVLRSHSQTVTGVAWLADGARVVSVSRDRTVRLWNVESGDALVVLRGHHDEIRCVAVTPDGHTILTGAEDELVRRWTAPGWKRRTQR